MRAGKMSRFLNSVKTRFSVNELELLGVLWAKGHLKYYLYGKKLTVITDHYILKKHRSKKSYYSRITRRIDKLMIVNFKIEHLPGKRMELVGYITQARSYGTQYHKIRRAIECRKARSNETRCKTSESNFVQKPPKLQVNCQSHLHASQNY